MDIRHFEFRINRRFWQFRSTELRNVVTAVNRFLNARNQDALDEVKRTYKTWQERQLDEFTERGKPIEGDMAAAILHAPGQYFHGMIRVIEPRSHPAWEPQKWEGQILQSTNCYAYACNNRYGHQNGSKQDPGGYFEKHRFSGATHVPPQRIFDAPPSEREINEAAVISGVIADNRMRRYFNEPVLSECAADDVRNIPGHYLIALIVSGADYHWYRQDNTGYWSQKNGVDGPSNTVHGELIRDPRDVQREYFTVPRFFHVPRGGVATHSSTGVFLEQAREHYREQQDPISVASSRSSRSEFLDRYENSDDSTGNHSEHSKSAASYGL